MTNSKTPLLLFLLSLGSCIQNPEAELQNERIKDLKEKNISLRSEIEEQNQKYRELSKKYEQLAKDVNELKSNLRPQIKWSSQNTLPDTLTVKVKILDQ